MTNPPIRFFVSLIIFISFLTSLFTAAYAQTPTSSKSYQFVNGHWFDGKTFKAQTWYSVSGLLTKKKPSRIDETINLQNGFVVPPFGDAHSHAYDNPKTIANVVEMHLRDGIFYGLSLTNSIKGKQSVAGDVNKPWSIDVGYADAGLTATLGHPILSAEVTANGYSWNDLGKHWSQLLKSRTAEGDVYFVIDNSDDLQNKWSRIAASQPDIIKIYLLDTENFEKRRQSTFTIDDKGLNPALVPEIVARARRSKLRVAAHVETAADFRVAAAAGVDFVAHLPGLAPKADENPLRYEITDADAKLAKKKKMAVVPTAWLAERLAAPKPWLSGAAAQADTAQLERAKQIQRRSLERLARHGVPIAIGSDLFENADSEAFYLKRLGIFDDRTLLVMWSQTTPRLIFPKRRIGRLTAGSEASLLALSCNPIKDFECTRRITFRMKQGRLLSDLPN